MSVPHAPGDGCIPDHVLIERDAPLVVANLDPEYREWGDGKTRKYEHVIEDISYAVDYIRCSCGKRITEVRDGLSWYRHKVAVGEPIPRPVLDRGGAPE